MKSTLIDKFQLQMIEDYNLLSLILELVVKYKPSNINDNMIPELFILLDNKSLINLLIYFAGQTVTFPSIEDLKTTISMILAYNYYKENYKLSRINEILHTDYTEDELSEIITNISYILNNYNLQREKL